MVIDVTKVETRAPSAAKLLKVLANENRLRILCALSQGEKSVGQLVYSSGLGQSCISQHLKCLRQAHIITRRRDGTTMFYRLDDQRVKPLLWTILSVHPQ